MEMTEIQQVDGAAPTRNPDAQAMALTGNTAVDLANIAREMGVTIDKTTGNVAEVTQAQPAAVTRPPEPAQPQAAPVVTEAPAVEVPAKFQNPDGTVNEEKLVKSTKSIEDMIVYYKGKEREAQQAQNRVNNPPAAPVVQAQPLAPNAPLSALERDMAQAIFDDARALGEPISEATAIRQARGQIRIADVQHKAAVDAARNESADIRRELGESKMAVELQGLIEKDNSLLTPQVADRLIQIKAEKNLPNYREAYIHHLGEVEFQKRTGQVQTPTPTGPAAKAPPTPVGPVARVQRTVDTSNPQGMTTEALEAEVRKLYPTIKLGNRL